MNVTISDPVSVPTIVISGSDVPNVTISAGADAVLVTLATTGEQGPPGEDYPTNFDGGTFN